MKKKLIIFNILINVIALLLMFGLGILATRNNNYEQTEQKIVQITKIYANYYSADADYNIRLDDNIRLTVVDATGIVLSDSDKSDVTMIENHINREEIVSALDGKPKTVIRYSSTLGKNMMYYAEKVDIGDTYVFIRVAIPVENVNGYIVKTIPLMLGILAASLLFSVLASMFMCRGLLKPLDNVKKVLQGVAEGKYQTIMPVSDDNEVNEIIADINSISEKLKDTIETARDDKQKLDYIINNVSDGIIVFGIDGSVALINRNASEIFDITDAVGKGVEALTGDKKLTDGILNCIENKNSSIFETTIDEQVFLCAVKYVDNGLIIAVLSDITSTRNNEKLRSEFFANASHELKTPLTSIKGFNELIAIKSKDKDIRDYSEKVTRESTRMLTLIDDMLNLSKLENSAELCKTEVDVKAVADEVADALSTLAKQKNISVDVNGTGAVTAEREHIFELIKNLAENAIRYNNDGGEVDICIQTTGKKTVLAVRDNGIGIDDEHQSRIFERFYRVDKSRSRETGGTGLGLSIVKHIAELYNADLKLTSKLGVGTEITVTFK